MVNRPSSRACAEAPQRFAETEWRIEEQWPGTRRRWRRGRPAWRDLGAQRGHGRLVRSFDPLVLFGDADRLAAPGDDETGAAKAAGPEATHLEAGLLATGLPTHLVERGVAAHGAGTADEGGG